MTQVPRTLHFHHDEQGFTLIETLVSIISAVVVVGALYAILVVALDQTTRVTDYVQATQVGRTTMTKLVDELHSACISSGFVPIKEGAEKTGREEAKLVFVNAYTKEAEIATAYKHEIVWEKNTGKLIDRIYTSSGGSWPNFTFPTTKTEVLIGENISESTNSSTKEAEPVFQYYRYAKKSTGLTSEGALSTLELLKMETKGTGKVLSAKEAEEAAAVEINFKQAPASKYSTESPNVDLKNLVTLSFSVPNAETPIEAKPCE